MLLSPSAHTALGIVLAVGGSKGKVQLAPQAHSGSPDDAHVIVEKPGTQIKFPIQAPPPPTQGSLF